MATKFKFMPALKKSYVKQGEIYFTCQAYRGQSREMQQYIRALCRESSDGDEIKEKAIFAFMTTHASWREVCEKYFISDAGLNRLRRRFYTLWG